MAPATVTDRISALSAAAADWREPDHPDREAAVKAALAANNRCTKEAMAFTLNQRMHTLTAEALTAWAEEIPRTAAPQAVALVDEGDTPLSTFHLWIAVILAGHTVQYRPPPAFPGLLPAFADAVAGYLGDALLTSRDASLDSFHANAVIAKSNNKPSPLSNHGHYQSRSLWIGQHTSIAIVGANPTEKTWEGIAEDALLYDGMGNTSPGLLFAPVECDPDAFLDACAHFRAVYPAHRDTPGRLKMQQAMLEALDIPHGYSDNLGFLVSKGEAEVQSPGHIRWVPYASLRDISPQLPPDLNLVAAPDDIAQEVGRLTPGIPHIPPGTAHRPSIEGHTSKASLLSFLEALSTGPRS